MGGGGKGGGGDSTQTIRYAPYLESHHQNLLNISEGLATDLLAQTSPYYDYDSLEYEEAFFGTGYILSDFPSLFDMFGKFMAGLDVDALFTQIFNDTINNSAIDNLVSQHAEELADDIEENASPRFVCGMRDINSVVSSSFVVGKAMMEVQRTRTLSKYDATLRHSAMPLATDRWRTHLDWNKTVPDMYAQFVKFYFLTRMDIDNHNIEQIVKDKLWPFTVLDYYRVAVGTLHGAQTKSTDVEGASTAQKAIGGALTGASAGYMYGSMEGAAVSGPIGALIGGVVGLGLSLF